MCLYDVTEFKYLGPTPISHECKDEQNYEQIKLKECLLSLNPEPFVFPFATSKHMGRSDGWDMLARMRRECIHGFGWKA
jgi:hypothetical protein